MDEKSKSSISKFEYRLAIATTCVGVSFAAYGFIASLVSSLHALNLDLAPEKSNDLLQTIVFGNVLELFGFILIISAFGIAYHRQWGVWTALVASVLVCLFTLPTFGTHYGVILVSLPLAAFQYLKSRKLKSTLPERDSQSSIET